MCLVMISEKINYMESFKLVLSIYALKASSYSFPKRWISSAFTGLVQNTFFLVSEVTVFSAAFSYYSFSSFSASSASSLAYIYAYSSLLSCSAFLAASCLSFLAASAANRVFSRSLLLFYAYLSNSWTPYSFSSLCYDLICSTRSLHSSNRFARISVVNSGKDSVPELSTSSCLNILSIDTKLGAGRPSCVETFCRTIASSTGSIVPDLSTSDD